MQLFDSHTHIHFKAFNDDMETAIRRAQEAGILMVTVGTQIDTSRRAVEVARTHEGVWATVGLHPNHTTEQEFIDENEAVAVAKVKTRTEAFDAEAYRPLALDPKCVGIGECGLDYYRIPEQKIGGAPLPREEIIETQKEMVRRQFELATEVGKPVVIHCRDAYADQAQMIEKAIDKGQLVQRGVMHCFTGTLAEAQRFIELGFLISFSGIVTFSKELAEVAKALPLEKILIETDAPYLAPAPMRGKRNEPAYVLHTAKFLAEFKGVRLEELSETTTQNAKHIFKLI
ncbi:TPA: hypothetical protein DDZ10_01420 [Candidatus Uhrbacteria bacterium]|uniref:Hydrolase, TatD family n=1 Tax=Candidatus Uhrbacteria bacterium GW2011_GWC2_53_7 TaxID=1618986 RepID=A0A0G2AUR5_9BACT|nr:MAG: Hydrolase, TatD family [Candidatus Uhrbacteria bacterium GW2011_GWC2_53_7]HBL39310.1 hypothetical protein [Candidatus Uhrbacteria bacterium]